MPRTTHGIVAWVRLARFTQQVQQHEAALLHGYHLTIPQFDVLSRLTQREGSSQQQLADALLVTKGNISGIVDRLIDRGWVDRRADPTDKRSCCLYLTAAGRALIESVLQVHDDAIEAVMAPLDGAEQRHLLAMLRTLSHHLSPARQG